MNTGIERSAVEFQGEINRLHHVNQLILDSVAEGIYGIDLDANVIFFNKAAEKLTGYTLEDFSMHNLHDLIHHTNSRGEHVPVHHCPVYHALNGGKSMFVKDDVFWHRDGTSFPAEYTVKPMIENGAHVGSVITFRDMTEKLRTDELMLEWEKMFAVGQLAAGIAHEIRNPLTTLKGFLKLMDTNGKVNGAYLKIMDGEFDRIETIIQELLTFSKPQVSQFETQDMRDILQQVCMLMEPHALLKNIGIVVDVGVEPLWVRCIEHQIKQVFINLIKNAIEALDDSGTIRLTANRVGKRVEIQVSDNGPGMSQEVMKKLGEPFYSTKEKGTGLGLMVTNNIIRNNHQGSIQVESEEGRGTTFKVAFTAAILE
ncbi:ATP-binding protein [Paenibacillus sp. TRM 82003]|nr:ATP-binding protein [Paenibacillus sp. TRM 82003]